MNNKNDETIINFLKTHRPDVPQKNSNEWEKIAKQTIDKSKSSLNTFFDQIKSFFTIKILLPTFALSLAFILVLNNNTPTNQESLISDNEIESLFLDSYGSMQNDSLLSDYNYYEEL